MHGVLYVRPIFTKIFLEPSVANFINIEFYEDPFSGSRLENGRYPCFVCFCVVLRASVLTSLQILKLADFLEIC